LATKVIQAYEDKKNHRPIEHLKPPTDDESPAPPERVPAPVAGKPTEVTGLWSDGGSDSGHLQAARFREERDERPFHRALAAPGMEQFAQNANENPSVAANLDESQHALPRKHTPFGGIPGFVAALPEPLWRAGERP
jgi:hypothetical protein